MGLLKASSTTGGFMGALLPKQPVSGTVTGIIARRADLNACATSGSKEAAVTSPWSAVSMSGGRRSGVEPDGPPVRVADTSSGRPGRLSNAELPSPLPLNFFADRFRSGLGNAPENRINLGLSFFADRYRAQRPCRPMITVDDGAAGVTVRFFYMRSALLENDARNSMEPFACWREANASKYRNELRLYDLLKKEICRRLTPLPDSSRP